METLRFLLVSSFYPPYHLGGDATHVKHLAEGLARKGHEVHVEYSPAAYRLKRPFRPPATPEPSDLVHLHPIREEGGYGGPASAYLLGESRSATKVHERLVSDLRPDVVHLHNISLLGLGVQWAPIGVPILYTAHDYWFRCPRSDLLKFGERPCDGPACTSCMLLSRRVPPLWRGADLAKRLDRISCVLAPSRFMARLARESFRCPVVHIPNFVPDRNPTGRVRPPGLYYLYAGVLEPHKGLWELARAAARYRGKMRFVLVGRGSLAGAFRALADTPGSRLEVRPWASPEELDALYPSAAGFVIPSRCLENSPLAAIEALSWGVPLLTTSRGGVSELLDGDRAGLSFDPTVEGVLGAVRSFERIENPLRLRAAARQAYEGHHRPEAYLKEYEGVVADPLAIGPEPSRPIEALDPPDTSTESPLVLHAHHDC